MSAVPPAPDPESAPEEREAGGDDAVLLGKERLPPPSLTPHAPAVRELSRSPRPGMVTPRPGMITPRPGMVTPRPAPIGTPRPPLSSRRRDGEAPAAPRPGAGTAYPMPGDGDPLPEPPGMPRVPAGGVYLSPRMTAIFGGLFGLATVTSVVALLIQVVPPRDERALMAGSASASASAAPARAPRPEPKKKVRVPLPGPWRLAELEKDPSAQIQVERGTMERKSLFDVLGDKGVPKAQVYRIMKALDGVRKFDKTGRRDRFAVALERGSKKVKAFEYEVNPSEIYQAREGGDGLLAGSKLDMKLAEEETSGAFYVDRDLGQSAQAGGFEEGLLTALDEALAGHMSTEGFEEGGTVRVIATEETALGLFSRYKRIVAMEYRPPDPAAKPVRVYTFNGAEARGYWDERGRQPNGAGWRTPCPGSPVTSHFNPKRLHPILKTVMPHQGTDFGAPTGTPIYAAYKGVVSFVGPHGATGNWVAINHPGGIETGYAHMSRFAPGLKVGDKVGTRQLVGYVGTTGRSTGPHLHFSARKNGVFFDAMTLHLDGDRPVPAGDRQAFLAAKSELDRRLEAIPLPEPPPDQPKPSAAASASAEPAEAPAPTGKEPRVPVDKSGRRAIQVGSPAAIASAAAEPGIHPSQFQEVKGEDDDDDPAPPPGGGKGPGGKAPDPAEDDDEK
jgi:murein DD-endopeptidase MepM/ murein hydrolase activator NlpD